MGSERQALERLKESRVGAIIAAGRHKRLALGHENGAAPSVRFQESLSPDLTGQNMSAVRRPEARGRCAWLAFATLIATVVAAMMASPGFAVAAGCPNEVIRERENATRLPDCRAYEQVTPVEKNSGDVKTPLRISDGGEGIAWFSGSVYPGTGVNNPNGLVPYVANRGETGWVTNSVSPIFSGEDALPDGGNAIKRVYFPSDLSSVTFETAASLDPQDQDLNAFGFGAVDVYQTFPGGRTTWLSHPEVLPATEQVEARIRAESEDGSTVFFTTAEPLTSEVPPGSSGPHLYRWRNGVITVVDRNAEGNLLPGGGLIGSGVSATSDGQTEQSIGVSRDGTEFVYMAGREVELTQLYLHRDGRPNVQITDSQRQGSVGEPAPTGALFLASAANFTKFLFKSPDQLTNDAPPGGGYYWYDDTTGVLSFSNRQEYHGEFEPGIVRPWPNGDGVYFVSEQVLGGSAVEGQPNLYLATDGNTKFIATLDPSDGSPANWTWAEFSNTYRATASGVSADGHRLVFQSSASLAGANNNGHLEVYLYDANSESITCLSCREDGAPSQGDATLTTKRPEPLQAEFATFPEPSRAITENGRKVFFTTTDSLLPADSNGKADVYEWDEGRLSLISGGYGAGESTLVGVSGEGRDVYFTTRDPLVSQDSDHLLDIYDAREGGGFMSQNPLPAPPECSGEACQHVGVGSSPTPTPGSAAVQQQTHKGGGRCQIASTSAKRLRQQADEQRRKARQAGGRRARSLRHKAGRLERQARKRRLDATACRKQGGSK